MYAIKSNNFGRGKRQSVRLAQIPTNLIKKQQFVKQQNLLAAFSFGNGSAKEKANKKKNAEKVVAPRAPHRAKGAF